MLFIALLPLFASEQNQICKGTPLHNNDSQSLLFWLKHNANRNKSIEDVLCCLPEKYQKSYKVAFASLSAQKSHYRSPRLLFGDLAKDGIVFSVSGGDPALSQSQSIEVMYNNPLKDELELFDIEFEHGRKKVSHKNPQTCISCHGTNGELGVGGPRPIFNPAPWPRMASASSTLMKCDYKDKYVEEATKSAFEAIQKNPRFSCLPPPASKSSVFGADISHNSVDLAYDLGLEKLNTRRVLKEIRYSANYGDIKHFLMGVNLGCFSTANSDRSDAIDFPFGSPQEWFPKEVRAQMEKYNPPKFFKMTSFQFEQKMKQGFRHGNQQIIKNKKSLLRMAKQVQRGENPIPSSSAGLNRCDPFSSTEIHRAITETKILSNKFEGSLKQFIQFKAHEKAHNGLSIDLSVKELLSQWAFESLGIDTSGWDMALIPQDSRSLISIIAEDPPMQTMNERVHKDFVIQEDILKEECLSLKEKSLKKVQIQNEGTQQQVSK